MTAFGRIPDCKKSGTGSFNPVPMRISRSPCYQKLLIVGRDVVTAYVLVFVLTRQRTFAQNRAAGWILSHLDHLAGTLTSANCSSSVECFNADNDDFPLAITCVTSSK